MEPKFSGPAYTVGIEEELMILDRETLELVNAIERLQEDSPHGEIKPELMESVLEVSTHPCADLTEAAAQLRGLRRQVSDTAAQHGLCIGSAGTHPFARWEDQRITASDRYRDLVDELRWVARQELIFGLHVHVGARRRRQGDPRRQRHARARADPARAVAPTRRSGAATRPACAPPGCRSSAPSRASASRPTTTAGTTTSGGSSSWSRPGVMEDYTWLWYDVRPHPNFGTVEIRAMDAQTHVEHTLALAALIQAMVKELAEHYDSGGELTDYPWEMLDENKWLAARHGLEGELVDLPGQASRWRRRTWRGGSTTG